MTPSQADSSIDDLLSRAEADFHPAQFNGRNRIARVLLWRYHSSQSIRQIDATQAISTIHGRTIMTYDKIKLLRIALVAIGSIFVVGVPVLMKTSTSWSWTPAQYEYEQMIMGVYVTLGVFLIRAARDPIANRSLIGFTIWSSIVHGAIMLVQSIVDVGDRDNLLGDIPALFVVAGILWVLMPSSESRRVETEKPSSTSL